MSESKSKARFYINLAAFGAVAMLLGGLVAGHIKGAKDEGPGVNVLKLEGSIGGNGGLNLNAVREDIDSAYKGKPLMVALEINSPGGSPSQAQAIHDYIRRKADQTHIPTVAFIEDIGASGGYYIALAGDKLYASNKQSIVGSIGVVSTGFNFRRVADALGVDHWVVTQGVNKHHLDPFEAMTDADRHWLEGIQAPVYEVFKTHVVTRRHAEGHDIKPEEFDKLFTGDVWIGEDSVKKGLADGVKDVYAYVDEHFPAGTPIHYIEAEEGVVDGIIKKLTTQVAARVTDTAVRAEFGL